MDGVLVDTAEAHYLSWVNALHPYGVSYDRVEFNRTFGMNNHSIIRRIFGDRFPENQLIRISDDKEIAFRDAIRGCLPVLPGVRSWLERFLEDGIPQAVASSAPMENIDVSLDEAGIRPFFREIVSAFGKPGKPDPWVFREAAGRLGVDHSTCIVIEDSPAGVLAAHNAGCHCIAVSSILKPEEAKTADLWVSRLDEVTVDDIQSIMA
jgi:beta-phosphoglucomutase